MSSRLRTDIWVAAYIRRIEIEGLVAMLRKRGAAEAGAIFIKLDYLNGQSTLYAPAPQSLSGDDGSRKFRRAHKAQTLESLDIEAKIVKEQRFDSDLWLVEVEDRAGRHFLDLTE
jgi:hypothetical protein